MRVRLPKTVGQMEWWCDRCRDFCNEKTTEIEADDVTARYCRAHYYEFMEEVCEMAKK